MGKLLFKMFTISGQVVKYIKSTMKNWRMDLIVGDQSLAEMKMQRVIFQRDLSIYSLLVGRLFCLTAYQLFLGHLMPNQVSLIKKKLCFSLV